MDTTPFEQLPHHLLNWLMTKGLTSLAILVAMYVGFLILQRWVRPND